MKATLSKKMGWHQGKCQLEFNLEKNLGVVSMEMTCSLDDYNKRKVGDEITIDDRASEVILAAIKKQEDAKLKPN